MLWTLCALLSAPVWSGTAEQETKLHLEQLRAITASSDDAVIQRYNQQMDAAWKYFSGHKSEVLPVLRRELTGETTRGSGRSHLLLLDVGNFLFLNGEVHDQELAKQALFALDAADPVIQRNQKELFEFVHAVAATHDARVLPVIDRAFLATDGSVLIPQHALQLGSTLMCAFLYGVYGEGAEAHLDALMAERSRARKIIEILIWMGSPESNRVVESAMRTGKDAETFMRALTFMMKSGGPDGQNIMLGIKPDQLDAKSAGQFAKLRDSIAAVSYDKLALQFDEFPGDARLSDAEVKKRLAAMYDNYGKDDRTSPKAILESQLSNSLLIEQLVRIRSRMFMRLSDEALSDVEVTNALLNALRYRAH